MLNELHILNIYIKYNLIQDVYKENLSGHKRNNDQWSNVKITLQFYLIKFEFQVCPCSGGRPYISLPLSRRYLEHWKYLLSKLNGQ